MGLQNKGDCRSLFCNNNKNRLISLLLFNVCDDGGRVYFLTYGSVFSYPESFCNL